MADAKVADKDITIENANGQRVVVVAAGSEVPDNVDELKAELSQGVSQTADADAIDAARGIKPSRSRASSD